MTASPRRQGRPATTDPARQAAYEAITAVHRDDAYANLVLPQVLLEHRAGGRDAALATELTYGTLRMRGQLDAILAAAARRDADRIDPPVRDALRLGAYQLLHTRVPAYAAVATTVDLVRAAAPGAAGFANAVLRRVGERDLASWLAALAPPLDTDPIGHLALVHSHPEWIVRAYADRLGGAAAMAEVGRALAANNERPAVHLCARPGRIDTAELAAMANGEPGPYSPYAVRLPGAAGAPGEIRAVADGRAHVQDEGSQVVALALASPLAPATKARRPSYTKTVNGASLLSERWLDLCAGPGGKAALLAALAAERGATLTAVEVAPHRARLVERAVAGLPATVLCTDGRTVGENPDLPAGEFDRVLVDAPCTGLGSLRRRPEARWRRSPDDLPALTRLQRELLAAALRAVRPGGVVAYVTCSPHLVETEVTVRETLRRSQAGGVGFERVDARIHLPPALAGDLGGELGDKGESGDRRDGGERTAVQLWPHRHGTDAMYLALIRRVASS